MTDHCSYAHRAWKNSGLNGIRTHDLCDNGAVLYRLSYSYNCDDQPKIYIFLRSSNTCYFIYSFQFFNFYGYIANSQCDQPLDGLIAQSVEHCTGIAEVMGSNPVQAWIFFQALISQLFKLWKTAMINHNFMYTLCSFL